MFFLHILFPVLKVYQQGRLKDGMVSLMRHRQTKGAETDRLNLNHYACSLLYLNCLSRVQTYAAGWEKFFLILEGAQDER